VTVSATLAARSPDPALQGVIKLAVMAVGGQGGGVLAGWIDALARAQGYACQTTSVAGVAQRTGATIYYIEMAHLCERLPVFSLAPAAGDVDILIASEMMEAGRAILRGFVTPDRTVLIASTHRALAVSEKMVPGDGIASSDEVRAAAEIAAQRLILFDMDRLAIENGSVISASLFGALAGARALPFPPEAFEAAIAAAGKGVEPSLRAFRAAFARADGQQAPQDCNKTGRPLPPAPQTCPMPCGPWPLPVCAKRLIFRTRATAPNIWTGWTKFWAAKMRPRGLP
jgi:indolepyruvate ferredoxin oxidoreductase, beta subunit